MNVELEQTELAGLLDPSRTDSLSLFLEERGPAELARLCEAAPDEQVLAVLRRLEPTQAAEVMSRLPLSRQATLAAEQPAEDVVRVLTAMAADDRTDLIQRLPPPRRTELLSRLPEPARAETQKLLKYPEGTVGAVMNTEFCALPSDLTAADALAFLRTMMPLKEQLTSVFVLDEDGHLLGEVTLQALIMARPDTPIVDLMRDNPVTVNADEPRTVAAELVQRHDLLTLPVINGGGRMIGVVTVDDVLDVQQEESTDDFHKLGSVGLVNVSLKDAPLGLLLRARLPWLLVLVFVNIFSGAGIAYFEDTLAAMISLAFFLPLLIDSGGNAGSQSATLMVRALATGDVRLTDWLRLLTREVGVSVLLGVVMAAAVAVIAGVRAPEIVVIVAMTMLCTVVFGSLIGMSLPFMLTRLRMDPATASAPLITSIADIGGVLIYFSIATWWLGDAIRAAQGG